MITPHRRALLALALASGLGNAHALVEAGHWRASPYVSSLADQNLLINVDQRPDGDYTGTFWNYDNGVLVLRDMNMDEGSQLFLVQPGSTFSNAAIASGAPVSLTFGGPVQVGQDFYLAARTGHITDLGFNWANNRFTTFGWAHFSVDAQGQLQILDSAMAFQEQGIVVSTLQAIPAIPEPGTWCLMGVGLLGLALTVRQSASRARSGTALR